MIQLLCLRCKNEFESECVVLAYCEDCRSAFDRNREGIHDKQRPLPGVFADGKFADAMNDHEYEVCRECGERCLKVGMRRVEIGGGVVLLCVSCFYGDDPEDDEDDEWDDEPIGSCQWCGVNIYKDDIGASDDLCEQCAWHAEQNQGGEDSGIQPIM